MDTPVQSEQSTNINFAPQKKQSNSLLFGIIFIAVLFILVIGSLSYFQILPLSKLWPPQNSQSPSVGINSQSSTPLKLNCPTTKEFCDKGQEIFKDQKYLGLGYKLATGSAIFAAFDGTLTATSSSFNADKDGKIVQKKFNIAYLDNSDGNFRATYYFRGSMDKDGKVKKGEQIATSDGKQISIYSGNSLVFSLSLTSSNSSTNAPLILNKEHFE